MTIKNRENRPPDSTKTGKETPSADPLIVVGLGASAGGLEALEEFFAQLPGNTGMAYVVVTHLHPGHTSLLPEILGKKAQIPFEQAADETVLQPNHAYVGPPGGQLSLQGGQLRVSANPPEPVRRLPIDYFFRSLADNRKERAICIVLSGTGSDGTFGLRAIKAEAGMALVQSVPTAKYAGMPSSAIATGLVDYILPPGEMPAQLCAYVEGPYLKAGRLPSSVQLVPDAALQRMISILRLHTGHDFSEYKTPTIRRRIERRMNVHQIGGADGYARFLEENPHEVDMLFKELLISVTSFFRDPEAWKTLADSIIPDLLRTRPDNYTLRAWITGCATGEEAYSVAIAMKEAIRRAKRFLDLQIFATDLDGRAIESARRGIFPEGIAADVPEEWLQRYFLHQDGRYRVAKEIREAVTFAPHNLVGDPPFTKLDFLSCRNLLIYLTSDFQKRVLPIFHYALKPSGILFLGSSESIGNFEQLFEPVDKKWKIFLRRGNALLTPVIPMRPESAAAVPAPEGPAPAAGKAGAMAKLVEKLLLAKFVPATVVADDRGEIVFIYGRTGSFLEPSAGRPRMNLIEMARPGLQTELAAGLRQMAGGLKSFERNNVSVQADGHRIHVDLSITRIEEPETIQGLLLVSFSAGGTAPPRALPKRGRIPPASAGDVEGLMRELNNAKETLRTTVEELESSNEELKSTNEELQSTNEELQSSNEELGTSREELQSVNEELSTVNAELQSNVQDLSHANDEMQNLLESTDIAMIFLDGDLKIVRYTASAAKIIRVIPTDVGRPISDLTSNLAYPDLAGDCREVLRGLEPKEQEIATREGVWHLMRIRPYRTRANVIAGLVITFININAVTLASKSSQEAGAYFESIVNTVREPLLVLDENLRIISANQRFLDTFQLKFRQIEGELFFELGGGEWDFPELRAQLKAILAAGRAVEDFKVEADFPKLGRRRFLLNARRLARADGLPALILMAMQDATGA